MPDGITMPDDYTGPDHIQLDTIAEDIGEDPGRWLDGNLDPLPRIRGLRSVARVEAWRGAEKRIQRRIKNKEPRDRIIEALDRRRAFLEAHGEYDPDYPEDFPQREIVFGLTSEVIQAVFGSPDPGAPHRIGPTDGPSFDPADAPPNETWVWDPDRKREALLGEHGEDGAEAAVATDGGEGE